MFLTTLPAYVIGTLMSTSIWESKLIIFLRIFYSDIIINYSDFFFNNTNDKYLFLRFWYLILELFRQCTICLFSFYF
jgi:hypothetical protein